MPIDFSSPRAVYLQIADDLRSAIVSGKLTPGERIPSRSDLAKTYGVSPETVKKAQDELAREGYLETQSTRGTFVLDREKDPDPTPKDLLTLLVGISERLDRIEGRVREIERR